jgi:hypothetical protein
LPLQQGLSARCESLVKPWYGAVLETKPEIKMNEFRIVSGAFSRDKNAGTHIAYQVDEDDVDALEQALSEAGDIGLQAINICDCNMAPWSLAAILPYLNGLTKLDASGNGLDETDCDALLHAQSS